MEATAHVGGGELDGETVNASLNLTVDLVNEGAVNRALTIGKVDHVSGVVFPRAVFWNPELAAAGVVDVVGEPAKGALIVGGRGGEITDELLVVPFAGDDAVEAAAIWLAPSDFTTRDVASFIFAGSEFSVWSEAKSAGST